MRIAASLNVIGDINTVSSTPEIGGHRFSRQDENKVAWIRRVNNEYYCQTAVHIRYSICSVIGALGRMYSTGALTDVALSAGGTILKAHRLVLASCSQYFAHLFKEVEADNTLVVVLGCEATELRQLLSFMYTGEMTASRRTLPALLRLARTLRVHGLTDADCTNPTTLPPEPAPREEDTETNSPINLETKAEPQNDNLNSTDNNSNSYRFNFEELTDNIEREQRPSESGIDYTGRCEERLSKLDQIVQNLYSTHKLDGPTPLVPVTPPIISGLEEPPAYDRKWRHGSVCGVCNKRLSNQYNLRVHMETHAGARHACRACSHVSRSRDALRKHVAYRHPAERQRRD